MEHIDPEELDALALGDARATPPQSAHLDACPDCREEVASVRRTAGAVRSARDLAVAEAPDSVWAAVHAELGLDPSLAATPRRGVFTEPERAREAADATPISATSTPATPTPAAPTPATTTPARPPSLIPSTDGPSAVGPSAVTPLATRRSRAGGPSGARRRPHRWLVPAVAASVALVLGVGGGLVVSRLLPTGTDDLAGRGDVVASASLAALPDWPDASGTATLRELPDGTRQVDVEVDTTGAAADAPLREVWLLTRDASGLVSIGFLDGATGTFTVPADVDLATYPIVDVSAEPQDGDPLHSGDSIVRGELGAS